MMRVNLIYHLLFDYPLPEKIPEKITKRIDSGDKVSGVADAFRHIMTVREVTVTVIHVDRLRFESRMWRVDIIREEFERIISDLIVQLNAFKGDARYYTDINRLVATRNKVIKNLLRGNAKIHLAYRRGDTIIHPDKVPDPPSGRVAEVVAVKDPKRGIVEFIKSTNLIPDQKAWVKEKPVYDDYIRFCAKNKFKPYIKRKEFRAELEREGFFSKINNTGRILMCKIGGNDIA